MSRRITIDDIQLAVSQLKKNEDKKPISTKEYNLVMDTFLRVRPHLIEMEKQGIDE